MNILNTALSSSFISRYLEMKDDTVKKIPVITDWNQYQDSLKNSVLYWDGDKFVNGRVINQNYLKAKNSLKTE